MVNAFSNSTLLLNGEASWTDLPKGKLSTLFFQYDNKLDNLSNLIERYHTIEKGSWKDVVKRVDALQEISFIAVSTSQKIANNYLVTASLKLAQIAINKCIYLNELLKLKEYRFPKLVEDIFENTKVLAPYQPLVLNNIRRYNFSTEEVWGEYFIEAVDPCHRRLLNSYYDIWKEQFKSNFLPDFFIWLEDKSLSVFFPSIRTFSKEELEQKEVFIKSSKFYYYDNSAITTIVKKSEETPFRGTTFSQEHIFIINNEGKIYLTYSSKEVGHCSMSYYKPLIGSGKLLLQNGEVKVLAFDSGHYLPDMKHYVQTIKFFKNQGLELSPKIEVEYFVNGERVISNIEEFYRLFIRQNNDSFQEC